MIIITDEVQDSMDYYPMQLLLEFCPVLDRVFTDGIYTYEKITRQLVTFAVIKGNDVGKIIMLKILLVYVKNVIV